VVTSVPGEPIFHGLDQSASGPAPSASPERPRRRWGARSRLALGLSPTPHPGIVLLLAGVALGPHGLGLLSDPVLSALDPAVSVALASLGVFIGLDLKLGKTREKWLMAAATAEAGMTVVLVAAGVLAISGWFAADASLPWLLAILLGICASTSATATDIGPERNSSILSRLGDLDDVLPIALGGIALASMREIAPSAIVWLLLQSTGVALLIGWAGSLLVAQTSSDVEQRSFAIGTLLLLGGAAAYLSLSALFFGLVAGALWSATGSMARDRITRDVRYLQHPLVVLLLVVAGARWEASAAAVGLVAVYLTCRLAGKLAGGWMASRIAGPELPSDLGLYLMSPGVVGIAFAVNAAQTRGDLADVTVVLTTVVTGSFCLELLTLLAPRSTETT
jgi:hypothetical protein